MASSLITTRFTAESTAADVMHGHDLHGLRCIVTGASSGLGAETAAALPGCGAEVTLAVRDVAAGSRVADRIETSGAAIRPRVGRLDLTERASVASFVGSWDGPLHLLVNNAGIVTGGLERTPEGWELQLATNHLGHFALTAGLHDALARGAVERDGARIVVVSSTAHMRADVDFDDLHFVHRAYNPQLAYAQSKTANSLHAVALTRRWRRDGIVANTVNPGGIRSGLQRNFTQAQKDSLEAAHAAGVFTWKTPAQGAASIMIAAVAPEFAHTGGHYLDDGQEAYLVSDDAQMADHPHGVKRWALDPGRAEQLWAVSDQLLAN